MSFPDFVTELLKDNNWTYAQLGELMGVSHAAVGGWVRGTSLPDPKSIQSLAELTHTDPIEIMVMCGYLPEESLMEKVEMSATRKKIHKLLEQLDERFLEMLADQIRYVILPMQERGGSSGRGDSERVSKRPDKRD